jgi:hypothetical protein
MSPKEIEQYVIELLEERIFEVESQIHYERVCELTYSDIEHLREEYDDLEEMDEDEFLETVKMRLLEDPDYDGCWDEACKVVLEDCENDLAVLFEDEVLRVKKELQDPDWEEVAVTLESLLGMGACFKGIADALSELGQGHSIYLTREKVSKVLSSPHLYFTDMVWFLYETDMKGTFIKRGSSGDFVYYCDGDRHRHPCEGPALRDNDLGDSFYYRDHDVTNIVRLFTDGDKLPREKFELFLHIVKGVYNGDI